MDGKIIDITRDLRKARRKAWLREKYQMAKHWCQDNKELSVAIVTGAIGLATAGIKAVAKHGNLRKEEHVKNEYCYDRSLGHYWELRRKLSNDEWVEIDKRKKNGERLADILDSLKVLK